MDGLGTPSGSLLRKQQMKTAKANNRKAVTDPTLRKTKTKNKKETDTISRQELAPFTEITELEIFHSTLILHDEQCLII